MAENFYAAKTALHVGIIQVLCGLISIAIGAFNTRKEDHKAFITFKPEGLPVWSGIMFTITGGVGCLSYKNPRKLTIHVFLGFCVLSIITSILMYWLLLPVLISGEKLMSWNLFFGSFLGVAAISFVVSMKGSFVSFKASFFQHNCWNQAPNMQHTHPPVELSSSAITSTSVLSEDRHVESREHRRTSRSQGHPSSAPRHHSHRHHRSRDYQSSRRGIEREARPMQHDERPPPPPYQTIKLPHLPAYHELASSTAPPPYTEKPEDT